MGVDTGGLQQPDELGEGFPVAIVRGRGGQDEGIGIGRQGPGQTVVLSGVTSDVVGLVNDDGVPFVTVKVVGEAVLLEGVHRNDDALVPAEGVAVGGDFLFDALQTYGVETDEWDSETAPHLVLHLFQHMTRTDDEDAFATAPADEFGEDHPDLDRLSLTHRVR